MLDHAIYIAVTLAIGALAGATFVGLKWRGICEDEMTDIFVFGSNLAGRHGKGAALHARQHHGAIYGQGEGLQGRSYAIPTKDDRIRTLPLDVIRLHVGKFLACARYRPDVRFLLTPIGCGLAGYKPEQIAPMFRDAPPNVIIPDEFKPFVMHNTAPVTPETA